VCDLGYVVVSIIYIIAFAGTALAAVVTFLLTLSILCEDPPPFPWLENHFGVVREGRGLIVYDWRLRLLLWWRRLARRWDRWWASRDAVRERRKGGMR